jgi:hypothetical protein
VKQYIGCDSHARYSVFVSVDEKGRVGTPVRVDHGGRGLRDYLDTLEKGTPVAVEASGGCWYWFMDELWLTLFQNPPVALPVLRNVASAGRAESTGPHIAGADIGWDRSVGGHRCNKTLTYMRK